MTRLFSLCKAQGATIAGLVLIGSVGAGVAAFFGYGSIVYAGAGLATVGAGLLLAVLVAGGDKQATNASAELAVIGKIAAVCDQIVKGNFEARLVDIAEEGPLARKPSIML